MIKPSQFLAVFNSVLNSDPCTAHLQGVLGTELIRIKKHGITVTRGYQKIEDYNYILVPHLFRGKDKYVVAEYVAPYIAVDMNEALSEYIDERDNLLSTGKKIKLTRDDRKIIFRPRKYKARTQSAYDPALGEMSKEELKDILDADKTDLDYVGWVRYEKGRAQTSLEKEMGKTDWEHNNAVKYRRPEVDILRVRLQTIRDVKQAICKADFIIRREQEQSTEPVKTARKKTRFAAPAMEPQIKSVPTTKPLPTTKQVSPIKTLSAVQKEPVKKPIQPEFDF